jgi:D-serine deaminase-like pyridoxal phosphate-dependent protein
VGIAEGGRFWPGDRWGRAKTIGLAVEALPTPALILDVEVARSNAALMAERFRSLSASLRPHVKAHKCADLARLQIELGAIGVTTATVAEAEAMVSSGVSDVLIANEVVGAPAIDRVVEIASAALLTVLVDDLPNLEDLGRRADAAGATLGVLIEIDVGMRRGGARSTREAFALARCASETRGVELRGLMGYEGHCASEPDDELRAAEARAAMGRLTRVADRCRAEGLPVDIVSAGATGTYPVTGAYPGVTEVQAGTYILMDTFHAELAPEFSFALTVATRAISRHDDLVVFDAGRKAAGNDLLPPRLAGADLAFIHEEHSGFRFPEGAPYGVGDTASLVPGYAPTTVNLFGAYHVVESGRVVDLWPVLARR